MHKTKEEEAASERKSEEFQAEQAEIARAASEAANRAAFAAERAAEAAERQARRAGVAHIIAAIALAAAIGSIIVHFLRSFRPGLIP